MDDAGTEREHDTGAGRPGDPTPVAPRPAAPSTRAEACFDWCFRNRQTGEITIAQLPNVALGIFLASFVARLVVPAGTAAHLALDWIGAASLGWWALDEVVRGVNPWRRALGVGGTVLAASAALTLLR